MCAYVCTRLHTCIVKAVDIIFSLSIPLGTTPPPFNNNPIQSTGFRWGWPYSPAPGAGTWPKLVNQSPSHDLFFRAIGKESAISQWGFKQEGMSVLLLTVTLPQGGKSLSEQSEGSTTKPWRELSLAGIIWTPGCSCIWSSHLSSQLPESIMNSPSCLRQYKLGFYHFTHEILDQGKISGPTTFHKRDEEARLRTQVQKSEIKMNHKKHTVRQDCHDNRTAMRWLRSGAEPFRISWHLSFSWGDCSILLQSLQPPWEGRLALRESPTISVLA